MNENNTYSLASIPTVGFQSTSSMHGSGSMYASAPTIGTDGMASTSSTTGTVASGPRRIAPPTPTGNPTPVGDAAWPFLFMALLYTLRLIKKFNIQKNKKR